MKELAAQLTAAQSRVARLQIQLDDTHRRYLKWFHRYLAAKQQNAELKARVAELEAQTANGAKQK